MLNVLFLTQPFQRKVSLVPIFDSICRHSHCDLRYLDADQQNDLAGYLKEIDTNAYDFVMIMLRNKKVMRQVEALKPIRNLVFLEHDACQNYMKYKYRGKFSTLYKALPQSTVLSSGYTVSKKLEKEGINTHFVPKGYDQTVLKNLHLTRDVEAAFVGTINKHLYKSRYKFLRKLTKKSEVQIITTNGGADYLNQLNRIRFFISADIKFGEYMLKNFEAMACGCVVFAWDQGESENQALGFKHMQNIVLYHSHKSLLEKLKYLRERPELANQIAHNGQKLVEQHYTFDFIGQRIIHTLEEIKAA